MRGSAPPGAGRAGHRPLKSGARLSMNALTPSRLSSLANAVMKSSRSSARPAPRGVSQRGCGRPPSQGAARRVSMQRRWCARCRCVRVAQRVVVHQHVDQPDPEALPRPRSCSPDRIMRSAVPRTDQPRKALRAAAAGDQAEPDLRLTEPRGARGDAEVARHGQLAAAADREAVDHGDGRLRVRRESRRRRGGRTSTRAARAGVVRRTRAMSAPATNALPTAPGDDDHADVRHRRASRPARPPVRGARPCSARCACPAG
jgi:hypothetical protein